MLASDAKMQRPRILCVDDEPHVLEGLQRVLRNAFDVSVANSGPAALARLAEAETFEVVVSDMRMPGMTGAVLLAEFRVKAPDTVRMLLTGQADLDSAIAAVNEGHVFRFLTKPCPPATLVTALRAATQQYRLLTTERVLLEQTLLGSVRALTEVLSLTHPETFGPATLQHERARAVAQRLHLPDAWHVEVASMLASVGYVVLPSDVLIKLNAGKPLDETEREMVARVPSVVERITSHIPRLEKVQEVLKHLPDTAGGAVAKATGEVPIGAKILRAVRALASAEARLGDSERALTELVAERDRYDGAILDALIEDCRARVPEVRSLRCRELQVGMVLLDEVKTETGMLLVARGQRVTTQLLMRLENFGRRMRIIEPIRCEVPVGMVAPTPTA